MGAQIFIPRPAADLQAVTDAGNLTSNDIESEGEIITEDLTVSGFAEVSGDLEVSGFTEFLDWVGVLGPMDVDGPLRVIAPLELRADSGAYVSVEPIETSPGVFQLQLTQI